MSQLPIREYDAKRLRSAYSWTAYRGVLIEQEPQIDQIVPVLESVVKEWRWVVKPDQLFGKRGKYGLVWVNLDAQGVKDRLLAHWHSVRTINGVIDHLDTFLVEPFVVHDAEWYLSLSTEREYDLIRFSALWGIAIEEHRESVREMRVGLLEEIDKQACATLVGDEVLLHPYGMKIVDFIQRLFQFFRTQWFVSLEINPFVLLFEWDDFQKKEEEICCLDMVAKVDSCEIWRQQRAKYITRVKPFGTRLHPSEAIVESVDEKTGASLKLTIINPEGRLWFLLGGGGASVLVMDALVQRGLFHEVANYGELSGNPDEESNTVYVTTLIETMLANGTSDQYLCLVGWIANFTDIVALVKPLCAILKKYASVLVERNIMILMRRGGLRGAEAMQLLATTCADCWIACKIYDDEHYLTEVFDEVRL